MEPIKIKKIDIGKIRSGIRPGSVIIDKKTKEKKWRKRKHKKNDSSGVL